MRELLVPTPEYIKQLYLKNQPVEVLRLLSLEPEFNWDMITELDLGFSNIIQIVGLRVVRNLKKLSMVHNGIRKIENLHWLTKIEYLDLSFNKITKIENLESLTAMKFLSLLHNGISVLENLDKNTLLETFFINDNAIIDVDQIFYMARFERLQNLDVSNNPAAQETRQLIIDRLPKLLYLNGEQITDRERPPSSGSEEQLTDMENAGHSDVDESDFLTDMDGPRFIDYLYREDQTGKLLRKWNSTVRSAFGVYAKEINEHAMELHHTILNEYEAPRKI